MKTLCKDYPKVRQYVKHGNTYCQVDLRGKHHVGQKFKNFNDRSEAMRFAADIGDTVAKNGISALARLTTPSFARMSATRCIESGKDSIIVAGWMGHHDNGRTARLV